MYLEDVTFINTFFHTYDNINTSEWKEAKNEPDYKLFTKKEDGVISVFYKIRVPINFMGPF